MGKKEVRREDIIEALKKIAFGRANHGVELAYLEKATPQRVQRMDLSAVAEFKRERQRRGGGEIRRPREGARRALRDAGQRRRG